MTSATEHMRLADDGNPHCGEHVRLVQWGPWSIPQVGPVVVTVREVYTDWSQFVLPPGIKYSLDE